MAVDICRFSHPTNSTCAEMLKATPSYVASSIVPSSFFFAIAITDYMRELLFRSSVGMLDIGIGIVGIRPF